MVWPATLQPRRTITDPTRGLASRLFKSRFFTPLLVTYPSAIRHAFPIRFGPDFCRIRFLTQFLHTHFGHRSNTQWVSPNLPRSSAPLYC